MRNQPAKNTPPADLFEGGADAEPAAQETSPRTDAANAFESLGMGGANGPASLKNRPPGRVVVKQFRVMPNPASRDGSGNWAVVYKRAPTTIRAGKVVDERTHDLKALRDCGVRFEDAGSIEVVG